MKKSVSLSVLWMGVLLRVYSGGAAESLPADPVVPAVPAAPLPIVQAALSESSEPLPSLEEMFDAGYWITRPSGSAITLIGVAGRRTNREAAVQEALADAARKAALYHGLHAESAAVLNQGSGALDYSSGFDYRITPANSHEVYIDALDYDKEADVLEKNGVVMVRVRYRADAAVPSYTTGREDGVPDWTKRHPADISGFLVGVGQATNKGSLQRTCQASYETAIASVLSQLSTRVGSEVVDIAGARITRNTVRSEGDITGVMILETWLDKRTSAVWTLVVAQETK
jgi:hypothetical protein